MGAGVRTDAAGNVTPGAGEGEPGTTRVTLILALVLTLVVSLVAAAQASPLLGDRAGSAVPGTDTTGLLPTELGQLVGEVERELGDALADVVDDAALSLPVPATVGTVVHGLPEVGGTPARSLLARAGVRWTGRFETPLPFSAVALEFPDTIDGVWVRTTGPLGTDPWTYLPTLDDEDGPDAGTREAAEQATTAVTELLWAGVATHLEVLVPGSTRLDEVRLHLSDTLGLGEGLLDDVEARIAELGTTLERGVDDPERAVTELLASATGTVGAAAAAEELLGPLDPISALLDDLLGGNGGAPEPAPQPGPTPKPAKKHWTDGFRGSSKQPEVTRRSAWGADESWRRGRASSRQPRFAVIHHTATRNDYSKAEGPAIVRAIYRYHTKTLGWSDIGYNFLIDRYGRIYQGRAGGLKKGVVGAHARNHNAGSVGIALIGNFEDGYTTRAALRSLTNLTAWQYRVHGIDPGAKATTTHNGRRIATLIGHRDVGSTACPGRHVTKHLPDVRRQIARARR